MNTQTKQHVKESGQTKNIIQRNRCNIWDAIPIVKDGDLVKAEAVQKIS